MKHVGCVIEFTDQRNAELMKAYRKAIRSADFIDIDSVSEIIANAPCSRFWVSEERATIVMSAILNGQPILDTMRPLKREMFEEIFRRVSKIREGNPDIPLFDAVMEAVNSPAPKFYIRPRCAMAIIYKIKNGFYDNQKRNR